MTSRELCRPRDDDEYDDQPTTTKDIDDVNQIHELCSIPVGAVSWPSEGAPDREQQVVQVEVAPRPAHPILHDHPDTCGS